MGRVSKVDANIFTALTGYFPSLVPEMVLGTVACVLFLGGTWRANRNLWGGVALGGLIAAGIGLWATARWVPTVEARRAAVTARQQQKAAEAGLKAEVYAAPVQHTRLALL